MTTTTADTIAHECIARQVRQISRAVSGIFDEALRPVGIKASQLNVLVATAVQGVATPANTCHHLCMDSSTLSRNVDRLRQRGWIETVPGEDLRAQPFRLTAAGRRLLDKAIPLWQRAQDEAAALLGPRAIDELGRMARRVVAT